MTDSQILESARRAAVDVLKNNQHGPFHKLPRTAAWGYPEPYTRDLMISALGYLVLEGKPFHRTVERVLDVLAQNQTPRGHVPSLVHDPEDRGASDTTPLFLLALAAYRQVSNRPDFLEGAAQKAQTWMDYQSPSDRVMVAQLPTSDWRDEQWVLGFGLFVNAVVYAYLRLFGQHEKAEILRSYMSRFTIATASEGRHRVEGVVIKEKPYYALWSYKIYSNERLDLLGNSLAILSGLAPPSRAARIIHWIEEECDHMQRKGELAIDLPPNLFPYIQPGDSDWRPRYEQYNQPGEYHNGGIWPFICGFYIAALVAVGRQALARRKLVALAELSRASRERDVAFGFNEYYKAQTGEAYGQDWQTWSAAMFVYAHACVERGTTPFFDHCRQH